MNPFSDQALARRALEQRLDGGHQYGAFLRRNLRYYGIICVGMTPLLLFTVWMKTWPALWIGVGMFCGVLARDISWVRGLKKTWPFNEKVTDWKKVEELADGEPPKPV